jgi:ribonuclease HII
MKLIIGIDEAGRGPLAGPVTVGVFGAEEKIGKWLLKNIFNSKLRDSKKLSPQKREEIYKKFLELKKDHKINFSVSHISNKIIDKIGISKAIQNGINKSLKKINLTPNPSPRIRRGEKEKIYIRLDGLLKAPKEFKNQKTIIKGDEKDVFIACASIVAKVSRDKLMCRLAKKYPNYGFFYATFSGL